MTTYSSLFKLLNVQGEAYIGFALFFKRSDTMKKWISLLFLTLMTVCLLTGCGKESTQTLTDGLYTAEVTLTGGTGKATVQSPAELTVENETFTAKVVWSSSKYDYMLVDGEKYLPTTLEPGSTFEIPVEGLDTDLNVTADTTAMSEPHEIDYVLRFDSSTLEKVK